MQLCVLTAFSSFSICFCVISYSFEPQYGLWVPVCLQLRSPCWSSCALPTSLQVALALGRAAQVQPEARDGPPPPRSGDARARVQGRRACTRGALPLLMSISSLATSVLADRRRVRICCVRFRHHLMCEHLSRLGLFSSSEGSSIARHARDDGLRCGSQLTHSTA